jgi:Ca2+:H+ antiporter
MRDALAAVLESRLNVLLIAAPATWVLARVLPESPWTFVAAAVSLVPLAAVIGLATDQLALRSGPAVGGLLNATFGNAAELIIAIVALGQGHADLVKASITGSIVGNLLLVLGLSFMVGGLGRRSQKFNRTAATNAAALLFLAVVALVAPAVFDLTLYGTLSARPPAIYRLSICSAVVLIAAYIGNLVYAFTVQRDLLRSGERGAEGPTLTSTPAVVLLAGATILTTVQAELLVGALQPTLTAFGLTELFVGVIVIAIVGNAAEHYSALVAGRRDQMTLAVEIAVGSSAQISLSVLATAIVVVDGESNWVEGLQLVSVYAILALAFYFIPAPAG